MALVDALDEMVERADAARGDHRHRHGVGDGAGQGEVEAVAGAVAVHRGEQDLAGAELRDLDGIVDRVDAGRLAAAMGEDLPARRSPRGSTCLASIATTIAWAPNFSAASATMRRSRDRGGVDRHLVGAGQHQRADVLDGAHAAADRHRHEADLGGARDDVEDRAAVLVAGGDVEEAELVGAGGVIGPRRLDRIAGVAQVDEVHALDDAAVLDVEAGDDADLQHQAASRALAIMRERRGRVEPAVIERAAGDGALEDGGSGRDQPLDVVERGEAARGDHRDRHGVGERQRRLDVEALRACRRGRCRCR